MPAALSCAVICGTSSIGHSSARAAATIAGAAAFTSTSPFHRRKNVRRLVQALAVRRLRRKHGRAHRPAAAPARDRARSAHPSAGAACRGVKARSLSVSSCVMRSTRYGGAQFSAIAYGIIVRRDARIGGREEAAGGVGDGGQLIVRNVAAPLRIRVERIDRNRRNRRANGVAERRCRCGNRFFLRSAALLRLSLRTRPCVQAVRRGDKPRPAAWTALANARRLDSTSRHRSPAAERSISRN